MRLRTRTPTGLDERLLALADAVGAGEGVVADDDLAPARAVVARAGERLGHGVEHTVVALAGATGSGKSSLFNALVGEPLSTVGVRRPTTSRTSAAVWGPGADDLLDWLAVPTRHVVAAGDDDALRGLVLLDLPDHDSTAAAHRAEVDRVVGVADLVVWVLDPQKYADAAIHERYLRPLASHGAVLLAVLNQADRLDPSALAACRADLGRLLADDGLRLDVLPTSATTGAGVDELRGELARRVTAREAAVARLVADVGDVARDLGGRCAGPTPARTPDVARLREAVAGAAGVGVVGDAVARSHVADGRRRVGWPFTRWLGRLRPDPLRRLHLERDGGTAGRTSLPPPSDVALARLSTAARDVADDVAGPLPAEWSAAVRDVVLEHVGRLPDRLDAAVAGTDLGVGRPPRWWSVAAAVQWTLALVAVAGAVWLGVLAGLAYLRLPEPGTPELGEVPWPTAMLLGGAVLGLVLAVAVRPFLAVGARRRARRAERRLRARLDEVADEAVLRPVADLAGRHAAFCAAVARAAGH